MPQVFRVLCCYNCEMFQVDQVKKSNKWRCKVCNENQSLKKAFKIGSAADCRYLVQQLNMQKIGQKLNYTSDNKEEADILYTSEESSALNESSKNEEYAEQYGFDAENDYEAFFETAENMVFKDIQAEAGGISYESKLLVNSKKPFAENMTSNKGGCFLPKNATPSEFYKSRYDVSMETTATLKCEVNCMSVNDSNVSSGKCEKRPSESDLNISSVQATLPPLKKNRGFQIIKEAASKLC